MILCVSVCALNCVCTQVRVPVRLRVRVRVCVSSALVLHAWLAGCV